MATEGGECGRSAKHVRVLMYSHDGFGLGHVRGTQTVANALASNRPESSIVILTGSAIIRTFEFRTGIDFVCVPGVERAQGGGVCTSRTLNMSIEEVVALRRALFLQTAETMNPDIFIVDHKPSGFWGELVPTLKLLIARGCYIVFSVRDILDEPHLFLPEWNRDGAIESLERYYDEIWVHGVEEIYRPFAELPISAGLAERITYTGYLRRELPQVPMNKIFPSIARSPFILVTAGGGGDGEEVIGWVIAAYEADPGMELQALIVFGPHMNADHRRGFMERIQRHPKLDAISFDTEVEILMSKATAIVAMCGYNTFCEILSFDKPSLIVPRRRSRKEQLIRAAEAERHGLLSYIVADESGHDPLRMATALRALSKQKPPSSVRIQGLLDGLDVICKSFSRAVAADRRDLTLEDFKISKDDSLGAKSA
ncbi:hypothetical protein M758_2G128000 [Ceratodon purpureus]|nr:hypothetical protein M758_2G128000 [Ceratodon purpureus]